MFNNLRVIRTSQKVSCNQMANLLGLKTRSAYHKKENGSVPFSLNEARKIANFFGGNINDIFTNNIPVADTVADESM